jgi:phage-related protein
MAIKLGQFIKDFGSALWDELKTVLSAVASFLSSFFDVWSVTTDDFAQIHSDFTELEQNVKAEIEKIKNFSFEPHLKTRVINVPKMIDAVHDLIELIRDDLFGKMKDVVEPIHELVLIWQTEKAALSDTLDKPSGMVRAASFLHSVETAISQVRRAMDDAKDITELALEITDKLNGLDVLFLQQGNPRQRVKKTVSQRVGILHA